MRRHSDETELISLPFCQSYNCIIGVNPKERILAQKLLIEAEILIDKNHIGQGDWLFIVNKLVSETIFHLKPMLLERMALVLAEKIIGRLPKASHLKLTIKKPQALPDAQYAYVCLHIKN